MRQSSGRWFSVDTETGIAWGLDWGQDLRDSAPEIAAKLDRFIFESEKEAYNFYNTIVSKNPDLCYIPTVQEKQHQQIITYYARKYGIAREILPLSPVCKLGIPRFMCWTEYSAEQTKKALAGNLFQAFEPIGSGCASFDDSVAFVNFFSDILTKSRSENCIVSFQNLGFDENVIYSNYYNVLKSLLEYEAEQRGGDLSVKYLPESTRTDKYITISFRAGKKKIGGGIRIIDTNNVIHGSLSKVGAKAARLYGERVAKMGVGQSYDYLCTVQTAADLKPTESEKRYCMNDCMLAFFGYFDALQPFEHELIMMRKTSIDKLPFTLTQVSKYVADCKTIEKYLTRQREKITTKRVASLDDDFRKKLKRYTAAVMPEQETDFELIHKCAGGGCIVTPIGVDGIEWYDVHTFDYSSLYPAKALDSFYPCGEIKRCTADYFMAIWSMCEKRRQYYDKYGFRSDDPNAGFGDNGGFFAVRFENVRLRDRKNLLPYVPACKVEELSERNMQYHNKIVSCDSGIFYFTHIDLLIFSMLYAVDDVQFIDGFSCKMGYLHPILRERFISASDIKIHAKAVNKKMGELLRGGYPEAFEIAETESIPISKAFSVDDNIFLCEKWYHGKKAMLNAQYGLLYQKPIHLERIGIDEVKQDNYKADSYPFTVGMFVAQWGRLANVLQLLHWDSLGYRILYAHTDSAKITGSGDISKGLAEFNAGITSKVFYRDLNCFLSFEDIAPGVGKLEEEQEHRFKKFVAIGNMKCVGLLPGDNINLSLTLSGLSEQKTQKLLREEMESGKSFLQAVDKYLSPGVFYDVQYGLSATGKLSPNFRCFGRDLGFIKCCQVLEDTNYCVFPADSKTAKKNRETLEYYNIPNGWKQRRNKTK